MSKLIVEEVTTPDTNTDLTINPNGTGKTVIDGTLDMNGGELILDADADTSITADTDDQIDFKTGGTDRMHIMSDGKVGVGETSPLGTVHIRTSDASITSINLNSDDLIIENNGNCGMSICSSTSGEGNINFIDSADSNIGRIQYIHGTNVMHFRANDITAATIGSNGGVGIGDTTPDSLLKVQSISGLNNNAQLTYFYDSENRVGNYRQAAHASFSSTMSLHYANRSQTSNYNFFMMGSNGAGDTEFKFRGDGQAYADGSWNGGGADYAEYFEWDDGNSSDEDRRGYSVVLVGNKIRKATSSDAAADIIGVVSAMPAVTGDAAWERWEGKYLTDDYGSYLKEAYTATTWTDTDADGVETPQYYETDKIPADVTVPSDAVVTSTEEDGSLLMRRRLNPDYDEAQTYVPREERQEWDTIGLMGKLRLRAGQPTGDRWIKMRDVATDDDGNVTVEEWLVR